MTDITANVIVSMPSQLFTMARSFKAVANGKIYIGKIDTDPVNPENQIQVYVEKEDGSHVPVAQPIIINAGGYPVYNGQIAKFVTVQGHSMAVYDAYGVQQFYFPNVLKYDPEQFKLILESSEGATHVGTNHRGTLALDLDAIDRRPDGYGNSIASVLASGNDVQIEKDISITSRIELKADKLLDGVGGKISVTTPATEAIFSDPRTTGLSNDRARIRNLKLSGSVSPEGDAAYAVFMRDGSGISIDTIDVERFSGGVININTTNSILRDIRAKLMVFHPSLVAGGYGAILDETRRCLIDGMQFEASEGNENGRHAVYVSRSGNNENDYDGCIDTIVTNIFCWYKNKDDRNMWALNVRKSIRTLLNNIIVNGANGGVAYNPENGFIENSMLNNANIQVVKYQNGVGVYGVSQLSEAENPNRVTGFLDSSLILSVKPKNESITGADCIGYSLSGTNGRLANVVTNVPTLGNPIIIQGGAKNVMIDGVLDYINDGDTSTPAAMITFAGAVGSMQNITIRGVKTGRVMFNRLDAAIDVSVDYLRNTKISIASGVVTLTDPNGVIKRVAVGNTSITILFKDHVTQSAVDTATVDSNLDAGVPRWTTQRSLKGKELYVQIYEADGTITNPSTARNISLTAILFS